MASTTSGKFSCDACGKSYSWKSELAGKRVKCKCGQVMSVPAEDPALADAPPPDFDDLYALAEGTPVAAITPPAFTRSGGGTCSSCGAGLASGAVLCVACGTNVKTGKKAKSAKGGGGRPAPALAGGGGGGAMLGYASMAPKRHGDDDEQSGDVFFHPVKDLYIPAALVVAGTIMSFISIVFRDGVRSPGIALFAVGVMTLINLALTVPAVLLTVRLFDLGLGPIGPGVLKIAACAIAPGAIGDLTQMIFSGSGGSYIGMCISYGITLFIFMKLLDMDFGEVLICSSFIFLIRTWAVTALLLVVLRGFGVSGLPSGMFGGAGSGAGRITLSGEVDRDEDDSLDAIRARESDDDSIRQLHAGGVDAKTWIEGASDRAFANLTRAQSTDTVKRLGAAGATEIRAYPREFGKNKPQTCDSIIVVAPDDKGSRDRVFKELKSLAKTLGRTTPRDRGEKYWRVEFLTPQERAKALNADITTSPGKSSDDDDDSDQ